ncbi:MAG: hypothetical protein ACXWXY_09520 [Aeromicrobium sp.]
MSVSTPNVGSARIAPVTDTASPLKRPVCPIHRPSGTAIAAEMATVSAV